LRLLQNPKNKRNYLRNDRRKAKKVRRVQPKYGKIQSTKKINALEP